jgi:hypothetical protein
MMPEEMAVARLISEHLERRPLMQVQDVYKLLYQGVMGAEHILDGENTEEAVRQFEERLRAEYEAVAPNEWEPIFEAVEASGLRYRLNLGPFKARNGEIDELTRLCLEAMGEVSGSEAELREAWKAFTQACEGGGWPNWPEPMVWAFTEWLEQAGYPPVHHSKVYRERYHPAYRLIGEAGSKLMITGGLEKI